MTGKRKTGEMGRGKRITEGWVEWNGRIIRNTMLRKVGKQTSGEIGQMQPCAGHTETFENRMRGCENTDYRIRCRGGLG